jgi:hypothetical protein
MARSTIPGLPLVLEKRVKGNHGNKRWDHPETHEARKKHQNLERTNQCWQGL